MDQSRLDNLWFADEASFNSRGGVNRHNYRYWSDNNPGWYSEVPLKGESLNVFAAVSKHGILGPYFFEENVTGESYELVSKKN